jgi:hypothetical protein
VRHGGSVNKNFESGFLLVWKLSREKGKDDKGTDGPVRERDRVLGGT